jgi:Mn2+/Fe2+ NRAMP family transporter
VDQSFRAAPQFYVLYTGLIVVGAALVLWPGAPLLRIMLLSQVMNGILLPVVLVLMLRLAARRGLMQQLTMSRPYLLFCWVIAALLIVLDLLLLAATFLPAAL